MKLIPSKELQRIINKYKPIKQKEIEELMDEYHSTKNKKVKEDVHVKIVNSISRMLANIIHKNSSRFIGSIPHATFDDIFNQMVLMILQNIEKYDPDKSALTTWAYWQITPLIKTPHKILGTSIEADRTAINIDKSTSDDGLSFASTIKDDTIDVEDDYESGRQKKELMTAIKKLKPWEREVILNLFGFEDDPKYKDKYGKVTFASVGRALGWSKERVGYNVNRMLKIIKTNLKQRQINLKILLTKSIGMGRF